MKIKGSVCHFDGDLLQGNTQVHVNVYWYVSPTAAAAIHKHQKVPQCFYLLG